MPEGEGTYGSQKGRPKKPKPQMPSHVGLFHKLKKHKQQTDEATSIWRQGKGGS